MLIAKYKFDSTIHTNPLPENIDVQYTYSDIDNGDGTITRTLEGDTLPTIIMFETSGAISENSRSYLEIEVDISNLTNANMFLYGCENLTSITFIGNNNTITNMEAMFGGCKSLTSLDLSNFDTTNVTTMVNMFGNCSSLTELDVSSFDTTNVTNMGSMFSSCSSLTLLDISNFNTANVTTMSGMFHGCSSLTSLDLSSFDTANVTNMYEMFNGCSKLTSLNVSDFNTAKVTSMDNMFQNCSKLTSLDVSGFDTAKVTNMYAMFYNCSKLTSLDVSGFDTTKVTGMYEMFYGCSGLTSLDVSSFDTAKVVSMGAMFAGCSNLTNLDVSGFDTAKVTNMNYMFSGCSSLTLLDLSGFDTTKVTAMNNMFQNCSKLKEIGLIYASIDTINDISAQTPQATIFIDENLDTSEYTGTASLKVYKSFTTTITLITSLKKVGDKSDRLYWDDTDKCYYIEQWIDPNTNAVLATPNKIASAISLPINMKVFENETSVCTLNCEPSYMKCTVPYFDIPNDYEYNEADELEYIKQSFELRYPDEDDVSEGWGFMGVETEKPVHVIDYWLHDDTKYTTIIEKPESMSIETASNCEFYFAYYKDGLWTSNSGNFGGTAPVDLTDRIETHVAIALRGGQSEEYIIINGVKYLFGNEVERNTFKDQYLGEFETVFDTSYGLKALIDWVDNCTDEEFVRDFEQHFHKDYTLRYFCLVTLVGAVDNLG